jgi:diguanylate cyclase (GGDEF)-like protein
VGLLVFFSQCLWLLLHRANAERRLSTRMLSAILIADSLVSVARIWADVTVPLGNDLFKSGLYDTLAILIYQMLLIGLTLALFLMVNRRLSADLERDIAELKESEEKMQRLQVELRSLSLTDDLTGLSNRRGFMMLVEQELKIALRTKRGMFLLFSDLDDLKTINDTRGHSEGDAALLETANLLRETFRESDILARLGGDEFAVLAVETAEESVDILAARLQKNMAAHNACLNRSYPLSLSIGIARYDPDSPCPVEELLARADGLMYEEKRRKPPPYLSAES